MVQKTVLHVLTAGMVLDHANFVTLTPQQMNETIIAIRAANDKPLCIVDSAESYFTPNVLVKLLNSGDPNYKVVNEALGGFFTNAQIDALIANNAGIAQAAVHHQPVDEGHVIVNLANKHPAAYQFVQPPPNWSIGDNMSLGPTKIKRKKPSLEKDGTMFYMSPQAYEKLWLLASKCWAGQPGAPSKGMFDTGIGYKQATVMDDRISIGGNYIRRYEIEQVAKHRGWTIPGTVAQAA